METPKNCKTQSSAKFIIKAKPSVTHIRSQNSDPESPTSVDQQVELFLKTMISRSKHFKDLLQQKRIFNEQEFSQKYLLKSVCLKTILKTVLDKMFQDRRLGKNLKGLNKDNMAEIEGQILSCLLRQMDLYNNDLEYRKRKEELANALAERRATILQELNKLKNKCEQDNPTTCSN